MAKITDPLTGETRDKGVTSFSPPAEALATPLVSAASYSRRIEEKRQRMAEAKATKVPLGHAPPIPPGKLAPIADAARALQMPQPDFGLPPIHEPPPEAVTTWPASPPPKPPPPQPQIGGIGSAYAVNQAIARGEVDRPVNMREAKEMAAEASTRRNEAKKVSQETQRLLQMQHEAAQQPQDAPEEEAPVTSHEREAMANVETELAGRKFEDHLPFDFEALQRASIPLLHADRRKAIESRLSELNFEHLITKREIVQDVPIIPGKFTVGYRTVREKEHVWVLQYLYEVTGVSSASYIEELGNVCRLVCALVSINGMVIPDHRENVGQPNEQVSRNQFTRKLDIIMGFPTHVVADMAINFNWFSERVTKLFSVDNLKNG